METIEDYKALLNLIREEASKRNEPIGRSDSLALYNIRKILDIPKYGLPVKPEYGE